MFDSSDLYDSYESCDSYESYDTPQSSDDIDNVDLDPDWKLNKSNKDSSKAPVSRRSAGSTSIKESLKDNTMLSSSSSRKSVRFSKVVKNIPPAAESTSASYGDQKEDSDSEKSFKKQNSDNDDNTKNQKRTKTKSKKANVVKNVPPAAESTSSSEEDSDDLKEDSDSEKSFKKQNSDNDDNTKNQKRTKTKSKKANVQCLPTMGFDQQLQSGVPPLPENHRSSGGVPNMYTQTLRIPNQVPMQRSMRPMGRPNMNLMMGSTPTRGRNMSSAPRGRPVTMSSPMMRGTPIKRPLTTTSVRHQTPPLKRVATDRNSFTNNMNKNSPTIVKYLSESLTKSMTSAKKFHVSPTQQNANLISKRGYTILTVDTVNNSKPAGLSLNSAVSIIPTSLAKAPSKKPNELPNKVSQGPSSVVHKVDTVNNSMPAGLSLNSAVSIIPTSPAMIPPSKELHESPAKVPPSKESHELPNMSSPETSVVHKLIDIIDITGAEKPKQYWPCERCSKIYTNVETFYKHVALFHKSVPLLYKCDLCSLSFPSGSLLSGHRQCYHQIKTSSNIPNVIPIIDLSKDGVFATLQSMGITNYLPVFQLENQIGQLGIPLMSATHPNSMEGLIFNNLFNLGNIWKL